MSDSNELRVIWFGCRLIWDSNDWFGVQVIWMSNDLRFKWFGCQLMCGSNDFVKRSFSARLPPKRRFEAQKRSFSAKLPPQRCFEAQKRSFCARLPSKLKNFEIQKRTSFKIEALKLKSEAFLRDFLQNWSFEDQKRTISARLPSKMKLWKLKNETFLRDFLQKWNFDMLTRHLASEFQYVLTIFKWVLQKYCACHEKVEPRHTKSCNCHAKWSLQSDTCVTWNLQPFHGFCVGSFKHRHRKARNPCACHAKRIVSDPLQIHHACQRFCNPHEPLRLPRILQPVEMSAPATRKPLGTSKNAPRPSVFNDFDFQIVLPRRRGANFAKLNFQKRSEHATF